MKEPVARHKPARCTPTKGEPVKKKSRPLTIEVDGKKFRTTPTFDRFWRYTAERNAVEDKRRAGEPQPWTKDPVLQTNKFCSVFRVADRGSQFLIRKVIEKGSQAHEDIFFRVLLYSTFVKIETYQSIEERLGPLTWKSYDQGKYAELLQEIMDSGKTLYTGAFQRPAPTLDGKVAFMNHLALLEIMIGNGLMQKLQQCKYLADVFDAIYVYPGMGDFAAFQLLINLSYTPIFNFNENDFVIAGVGALEGLKKCFVPKECITGSASALIRWMMETQTEHFERLGLEFSGLGKEGRPMTLVDVEHTLCEVHKYSRLTDSVSGYGKRFTLSTKCMRLYPTLPKAWTHPARATMRPKPGRHKHSAKQYVVQKLLDRREDENGEVEYLVHWWGYSSLYRTWEPASTLLEDAPLEVRRYERKHPADASFA